MNELVIIPSSLRELFLDASSEDLVKVFKHLGVCATVEAVDNFRYFSYNDSPVDPCALVEWAENDVMVAENLPQVIYLIVPAPNDEKTVRAQKEVIDAAIYFILGVCEGVLHKRARVSDHIPRVIVLDNEHAVRAKIEKIIEDKKNAKLEPFAEKKNKKDSGCDIL